MDGYQTSNTGSRQIVSKLLMVEVLLEQGMTLADMRHAQMQMP